MHGDKKWGQSPNLWQLKIFNYQTYGDLKNLITKLMVIKIVWSPFLR
jgi:hypothetical protein